MIAPLLSRPFFPSMVSLVLLHKSIIHRVSTSLINCMTSLMNEHRHEDVIRT